MIWKKLRKKIKWPSKAGRVICVISLSLALAACGGNVPENSTENSFYSREKDIANERTGDAQSSIDQLYDDAMSRIIEENPSPVEGDNAFERASNIIFGGFYRTYLTIRSAAPLICLGSFAIGLLLFLLASKNKRLKRTGLFVFMIGIPVLMLIIVYGIGILNGIFLF